MIIGRSSGWYTRRWYAVPQYVAAEHAIACSVDVYSYRGIYQGDVDAVFDLGIGLRHAERLGGGRTYIKAPSDPKIAGTPYDDGVWVDIVLVPATADNLRIAVRLAHPDAIDELVDQLIEYAMLIQAGTHALTAKAATMALGSNDDGDICRTPVTFGTATETVMVEKVISRLMPVEKTVQSTVIEMIERDVISIKPEYAQVVALAKRMGKDINPAWVDLSTVTEPTPRTVTETVIVHEPMPVTVMEPETVERNITLPWEDAMAFRAFAPRGRRLYSQQLIGAAYIYAVRKGALWFTMRVGKTDTATAVADRCLHEGDIDTVIIVAPLFNLYDPWDGQVARMWGCTGHCILNGSAAEDAAVLADPRYNVILINYERVPLRLDAILAARDMTKVMVIADETSAIKTPEAVRTRAMIQLCDAAHRVVLLNGTPVSQGPHCLWSQYRCIDPDGRILGRTFEMYRNRWLRQVGVNHFEVKPELTDAFQGVIGRFGLRYTAGEADQFDGKDTVRRYVKMKPSAEVIRDYQGFADGEYEVVDRRGRHTVKMTKSVLRTIGFMRESAAGYQKYPYGDGYARAVHVDDAKALFVAGMLSDPGLSAVPFIILVEFNEAEWALKQMLTEMGISYASTRRDYRAVDVEVLAPTMTVEARATAVKALREEAHRIGKESILVVDEDERVEMQDRAADIESAMYALSVCPVRGGVVEIPAEIRYAHNIVAVLKTVTVSGGMAAIDSSPDVRNLRERIRKIRALADDPSVGDAERENAEDKIQRNTHALNILIERLIAEARGTTRCPFDFVIEQEYIDDGSYQGEERARQVARFNTGDARVFICKTSQARGIRLNAREAKDAGKSEHPRIIFLHPTWSLDSHEQAEARAKDIETYVKPDGTTASRTVPTMMYYLTTSGSIEDRISKMLRDRASDAARIMMDEARKDFQGFKDALVDDLRDAAGDNGAFDVAEIRARIVIGVNPLAKLTASLIRNKGLAKHGASFGINKPDAWLKFIDGSKCPAEIREAHRILMSLVGTQREGGDE